jgi:hypothetical protein
MSIKSEGRSITECPGASQRYPDIASAALHVRPNRACGRLKAFLLQQWPRRHPGGQQHVLQQRLQAPRGTYRACLRKPVLRRRRQAVQESVLGEAAPRGEAGCVEGGDPPPVVEPCRENVSSSHPICTGSTGVPCLCCSEETSIEGTFSLEAESHGKQFS